MMQNDFLNLNCSVFDDQIVSDSCFFGSWIDCNGFF
ncbi:hypothetical protein M6B38_251740 [Iris pallida]|uniref:Uncharacterized protein n=1 Tax=Iris pallida TaxID=29817 RepID=A0AAX6IIX0_IRIPA|nr:hypothetical protein M6B38_251740 [Iris pallida]